MEHARIFIARRGDKAYDREFSKQLEERGLKVVLAVFGLENILQAIKVGMLRGTRVSLALVEGYLGSDNSGRRADAPFEDGHAVEKAIRKADLSIKIIAYCSLPNPTYGDVHVDSTAPIEVLCAAIDAL